MNIEPVIVGGTSIPHNAVKWDVRKNRHTTTEGRDWGWIEGAPGNVCWENGQRFDRHAAQEATRLHNQWLEDQKPIKIKIIEQQERVSMLLRTYEQYKTEHATAKQRYEEAKQELDALCTSAETKA